MRVQSDLKGRPGYGLIAIEVAALRAAGFGVVRDPARLYAAGGSCSSSSDVALSTFAARATLHGGASGPPGGELATDGEVSGHTPIHVKVTAQALLVLVPRDFADDVLP